MQWKTLDDLCGSDHYPISISYGSIETSSAIPIWKLRKADWPSFSNEASELLDYYNPDISLDEFSEKLITIAKNNIPKTNSPFVSTTQSGLMMSCKEAINKKETLKES